MNSDHECEEDSEIIELISRAGGGGKFDEISYEECHCAHGYYISLKKGEYSAYVRRENNPVRVSGGETPTHLTLVSVIKEEGNNKKQIIYIERRPIAGTRQILKNKVATVKDIQNQKFREFLHSIYECFN